MRPHLRNNARLRPSPKVWNGGSFSHAALSVLLEGAATPGLAAADRVLANYKHRLRDWWDFKDLTAGPDSPCATAPGGVVDGQPWCNSHYTRQLIGWAMPLAMSGQQFDAVQKRLAFTPSAGAPRRLPAFAASFAGVLDRVDGVLTLISGNLDGVVVTVHGRVIRVQPLPE